MQWVEVFLFNRGLATWSGRHVNQSLLFPMEAVYEDFVTDSFRRYQAEFQVVAQAPRKHMASTGGKRVFATKPDISLRKPRNTVRFILDAKWKHSAREDPTRSATLPAPTCISSTPTAAVRVPGRGSGLPAKRTLHQSNHRSVLRWPEDRRSAIRRCLAREVSEERAACSADASDELIQADHPHRLPDLLAVCLEDGDGRPVTLW